MPKIRVKLKEMRDAAVDYVSLVDRSASRMPIRIMKADQENGMDLSNLRGFLSRATKNEAPATPVVTALVMVDPGEDLDAMKSAITDAGFLAETVTKADDGSMVFEQSAKPMEGAQLVRLSENLLLVVKGLDSPDPELGFVPDLPTAMLGLRMHMESALDSAAPEAGVAEAIKKFEATAKVLAKMPQKAFKAELAVSQVFKGKKAKKPDAETMDEESKETPAQEAAEEKTEVDKGCAKKADEPVVEVAPVVEVEAEAEQVVKADPTLEALGALSQMIKDLAQKVEGVTTDLASVKASATASEQRLDSVVQKVDTATQAMSTTLLTPPPSEILPTAPARIAKADDPRSRPLPPGFDSAFHTKSR